MAALISALDNYNQTPKQTGENGLTEYTWSNDITEKITQLSFQLTRSRLNNMVNLSKQTQQCLDSINTSYRSSFISREQYLDYMSVLFRMTAHTRDVVNGKGEYALSYMLLNVWYKNYPELSKYAFKLFVHSPEGSVEQPFGSWKDIKHFYKNYNNSPLVDYGLELLVNQLKEDEHSECPSLAAKWAPRENSQFSEVFDVLAVQYYSHYITSAKTETSKQKAINKAKMDFRKLLSKLNKRLDTVQIKQCGLNWAEIDPIKQTSITMHKQKNAFLNIKKNGSTRSNLNDRMICADNFKKFTKKVAEGKVEVKGKNIGLNDFTKEAYKLIGRTQTDSAIILNAQWVNNASKNNSLGKMIAMVDVSASMDGEPMDAAIALGIRVAEKSLLGKRVLTFSSNPTWVNLEQETNFIDMVDKVKKAEWGGSTNFFAALSMILDVIVEQKMKPEDVEDMVLVIFSDMQMDAADRSSSTLMGNITTRYAEAGNKLWGNPFKAPHILFWNLRSTSGFPSLSTQNNASMMSGFSPSLLNVFCDEGISALQSCTPWSILNKSLDNARYKVLDTFLRETL